MARRKYGQPGWRARPAAPTPAMQRMIEERRKAIEEAENRKPGNDEPNI